MMQPWRRLPPEAQDLLAAAAAGIVWFGAYTFWLDNGWHPKQPETYELAGVFLVAVVALRRATPWGALAAGALVYPFLYEPVLRTEFHLLPVAVAGYSATSTGRVRTPVAALACGACVLVLAMPAPHPGRGGLPRDRVPDWSMVAFAEFVVLAVVALGALLHHQRRTARELAHRNAELERLRRMEARQVVAAERTRIARELHDVVAHHLTAVVVRAQAAERVSPHRPDVAVESVGWIAATAREALTAMRQTVRVLRDEVGELGAEPLALAPGPVLADLREVAERLRATGLRVDLDLPEPLPRLDHQVELAALRIAQESLTNTLRHARASRASVVLRCSDGMLDVVVDDDGRAGGPPGGDGPAGRLDPAGGHGLLGMRERTVSCGGRFTIGASPLGGWRVHARLPATAPAAPA